MNIKIDRNGTDPAYIQLYRQLVRDIESGIYPLGTKLPSKRVMAADTSLSLITVEHALSLLDEEGYIESRVRSGYIVTYRDIDFLKTQSEVSFPVLDTVVPSADTGDFPFSVLTKTMRRVMLDYGEKILVKSPNHGCDELRNEICNYLARSRGIIVNPSQVIVGSGAEYLYGLIVQLIGTDRIYAVEDPSYGKIRRVYTAMGAECDGLKMGGDGILSTELKRTEAGILHVTPFNSFPSMVTADVSKKREYLRWAKERKAVIVEDNYDSELTVSSKEQEPLFSMDPEVDVIYVNTFSGTVAPSMRIGYMILPKRLLPRFNDRLGFYSCTVPIFEQYVLAQLIKSGDFERHINRVRRNRRKMATKEQL